MGYAKEIAKEIAVVGIAPGPPAGRARDGTGDGFFAPAVAQNDTAGLDSTYSLTWWTADAGGASYRTAGSYALGDTAGQPDAAPERSGSGYTLRAGFWQPSCVAAAAAPPIARAGSTVTLSWTHVAPNQTYQMHRATTPYFTPTDVTRRALVTGAPWSYTDPDTVIGNPNTNYFYLLRGPAARLTLTPQGEGGGASSTSG